jgi:hypothetical protein
MNLINSSSSSSSSSSLGRATRIRQWACRFFFPLSFFLVIAALVAPAQSTNDSSTTDFSSFQVIVDRNIFNPDRYGSTGGTPRHSSGVPTFSLAGTMTYRKGMFAFFNGTSDEYRKALQQGGSIAGYTVGKITFDSVQLQSSGKTIDMKVGAAMRREGGAWELSAPGEWGDLSANGTGTASGSETTSETSTNLPTSSSGGEESDVLKRLMEKRAQELK